MSTTHRYPPVCRKPGSLYGRLHPSFRSFFIISLLTTLIFSCKQVPHTDLHPDPYNGPALYKATVLLRHSKGFSLQYFSHYKVLRILNHFSDKAEVKADTLTYLLVQRGTPVPGNYAGAQVIEIPVQKMIVTSSMHIGMLDFADATDVVSGVSEFKYITSSGVRKNVAAGRIKEVGNGSGMNDELIISMHPGLVMTMGSPVARFSRYKNLIGTGIPVLINSEWLETDPLGRSEWVKLVGALLNKEALVNSKFDQVEKEYIRLKELTSQLRTRPSVIIGMPFKGSWFVPDGDSYTTRFLLDAGASYHWANIQGTGSLALDFETVAPVALTADYWLNTGEANSLADIAAKDGRYSRFRSYTKGTAYNNNKKTNDIGANDYWESGAINPQTILADLIRILHPELLPNHELVYYKQLK